MKESDYNAYNGIIIEFDLHRKAISSAGHFHTLKELKYQKTAFFTN